MQKKKGVGGFHSIGYTLKSFLKVGTPKFIEAMQSRNACKTCALGMGGQKGGMTNELGHFPEFCKKSIQAMQADFGKPLTKDFFELYSIDELASLSPRELEGLGRIATPLMADAEDTHFQAISWDRAFEQLQLQFKATPAEESFFYFSGRSSNEAGFLLQIFARIFGTNNVNNCSYYCHQASGVGLTQSLGSGTATVTLEDIYDSDLFFLIGANPSSNHPRLLTSLHHLRKKGGKVVVINPVVEPGLVKFKIPSIVKSLLAGSQISDHYIQLNIGTDQALLQGIGKIILTKKGWDHSFVHENCEDFGAYQKLLADVDLDEVVSITGVSLEQLNLLADLLIQSKRTIFSWAMGVTHHQNGTDTVREIVNLALLRGMVGKPGAGLLPLRGHSNVQGMGTVGVTPKLKEEIYKRLIEMGVDLPTGQGMDTMQCMEAAKEGKIKLAVCLGGNLYGSNPDSRYASMALNNIEQTVYLSTTLNQGHFFGRGRKQIILPVKARDEESQMTTQESMFSFVRLSEGGEDRLPNVLSEVEVIATLGELVLGNGRIDWSKMRKHKNIRQMMADAIPGLEKLSSIDEKKKEFTIPGRIYHRPIFSTPSQKARFAVSPFTSPQPGLKLMTIRSEGQFNTVVYEEEDVFRGVPRRDVILLNPQDLKKFGLKKNQRISVRSQVGRMDNIMVWPFDIKEGNALMYYPESNILVDRKLDSLSKTPAFKNTPIKLYVDNKEVT